MKITPIEDLNYEVFSPLVNTRFRVGAGQNPVELILTEAKADPGREGASQKNNFSLLFQGPGDAFLPQQIHSFEHEKLGKFDLFIVPVAKGANGFQYQAIFNRAN